ncbi:hypothetical protein BDY19DRAFT_337782 [Irpex rosettiformis]|uniref:Uncharacterized protein n=1 Tax=Irpex rosettiformis TaxID=378272 RepID=A0ACB8TX65_9APHY|nr:hypothetical protein BDY19DRAFT_337782 [Irpex rosettiformis]
MFPDLALQQSHLSTRSGPNLSILPQVTRPLHLCKCFHTSHTSGMYAPDRLNSHSHSRAYKRQRETEDVDHTVDTFFFLVSSAAPKLTSFISHGLGSLVNPSRMSECISGRYGRLAGNSEPNEREVAVNFGIPGMCLSISHVGVLPLGFPVCHQVGLRHNTRAMRCDYHP